MNCTITRENPTHFIFLEIGKYSVSTYGWGRIDVTLQAIKIILSMMLEDLT